MSGNKYRYLNLSDSPFMYSPLRRAIQEGQNRAPAAQWINIINSLRNKGVKEAEINDSGLINRLKEKDGPLTKDDLLALLDEQPNLIKEIDLSQPRFKQYSYAKHGSDYTESMYVLATMSDYIQDQLLDIDFELEDLDFYPERLIENPLLAQELYDRKLALQEELKEKMAKDKVSVAHFRDLRDPETGEEIDSMLFHTRHSLQDNGSTFFVEEVQSDWAQRGRQNNWQRIEKGPWVTNTELWSSLAFKRLMQRAAENPDIKRFMWITGDYRNGGHFVQNDGLNDFYIKVVGKSINRLLKGTGEKCEFQKIQLGNQEVELPSFNMTDAVRKKLRQAQPLYSRDAMRAETQEAARQRAPLALVQQAVRDAQHMLGSAAQIKLLGAMADPHGDPVAGRFFGRFIEVSLSGVDPIRALDHECWHYAYEHLLTQKQRTVADTAYLDPERLAELKQIMQAQGFTEEAIEQCDDPQEAVAHAYSLWVRGLLVLNTNMPRDLEEGFLTTRGAFEGLDQQARATYRARQRQRGDNALLDLFMSLRDGALRDAEMERMVDLLPAP